MCARAQTHINLEVFVVELLEVAEGVLEIGAFAARMIRPIEEFFV